MVNAVQCLPRLFLSQLHPFSLGVQHLTKVLTDKTLHAVDIQFTDVNQNLEANIDTLVVGKRVFAEWSHDHIHHLMRDSFGFSDNLCQHPCRLDCKPAIELASGSVVNGSEHGFDQIGGVGSSIRNKQDQFHVGKTPKYIFILWGIGGVGSISKTRQLQRQRLKDQCKLRRSIRGVRSMNLKDITDATTGVSDDAWRLMLQ